jgi:ribonucleotide reductase beta subunit family protein with ferritin-like domain
MKYMPQLIKGHLRFTEEDDLVQAFQELCHTKSLSTSFEQLNEQLRAESIYIDNLKDEQILEQFDTQTNVKQALSNALSCLAAIAMKEGYSLHELMKNRK